MPVGRAGRVSNGPTTSSVCFLVDAVVGREVSAPAGASVVEWSGPSSGKEKCVAEGSLCLGRTGQPVVNSFQVFSSVASCYSASWFSA